MAKSIIISVVQQEFWIDNQFIKFPILIIPNKFSQEPYKNNISRFVRHNFFHLVTIVVTVTEVSAVAPLVVVGVELASLASDSLKRVTMPEARKQNRF
jgi:hypothetical protein